MSRGKFEKIEDGITLFDSDPSPCARRVRMVLIEKDLQWHKVPVDLIAGEQKDPKFLKLNPNGKVPALAVKNVTGVPDCVLFESNVITEFLDASFPGKKLFPEDTWLRTQAKMWMDWELALVDHFVPFVYQNAMGTIFRLQYGTIDKLLATFPAETAQQVLDKNIKIFKGQYQTAEEMAIHTAGCLKQYMILERALEGKQHLVGNDFSIADLSVYPRVAMSSNIGLPLSEKMFPNICNYMRCLESRICFKKSVSTAGWIMGKVLENCRPLLVWLGNKRSGIDFKWFEAEKSVQSAFDELSQMESLLVYNPLMDISEDEVVVFDNPASVECFQMKLLLEEKGKAYKTVQGDILDLIGCPNGAGGLLMIQHGPEKVVTGYRTILEYIDAVFPGTKYLPEEPLKKARSQCWQAWEQGMYFNEIWSIFERTIIAKHLVKRYRDDIDSLLSLKTHTKYSGTFPSILRCFLAGIDTMDEKYDDVVKMYGHLKGQGRPTSTELDTAFKTYHLRLQHLETSLADTDFLVNNNLTLADICVFCRLQLLPLLGMQIKEEDYPSVCSWIRRLEERQTFKQMAAAIKNMSQTC